MAEIVTAAIDTIATNPYRRLHAYPYIPSKIDALQRSIAEVGLWPSIIARPLNDRLWKYEMAFGHHRVEAARRSGLKQVAIIVEKLSDKQMLQYMGRENLEDYNAVFLIQLESWEAAIKSGLVRAAPRKEAQPIDIASLLGWTRLRTAAEGTLQLNDTASACHSAYALIVGGYMGRDDFADLSVKSARDIAERAWSRIEHIEKQGKGSQYSARDLDRAKQHVGRGAADTAKQFREGSVSQRDLRGRVDLNAGTRASRAGRPSPLFATFANAITDNLRRTLQTDSDADKLAEIVKVLGQISLLEDWEALRRLEVELFNLGARTEDWRRRLTPSQEKIVQFKALEGGRTKQ